VNALSASPRSTLISANATNIQFIQDDASTNLGFGQIGGIDFTGRYDFDLGNWGAWNVGLNGNYQLLNKTRAAQGLPTVNAFKGMDSGGRLKYRGRLGWADMGDGLEGLSITGFVNYLPHSANSVSARNVPPACYWAVGFGPGSCYPGSPYVGPFTTFPAYVPGLCTFDLSIAYQTGTRPENPYLQNLNIQLTVNDLLDKAPPFFRASNVGVAAAVGNVGVSGSGISPLQRTINIAVTKAW
jgi:hypothetical protein